MATRTPVIRKSQQLPTSVPIRQAPARSSGYIEEIRSEYPEREKKSFSLRDSFGISLGPEKDSEGKIITDSNGQPVLRDRKVVGFVAPTEHTPAIKPEYVFPQDETLAVLMGMNATPKDPILLLGNTGSGKTSLLEQICARINYGCIKISFDAAVMRGDIVGETVIVGRETKFQYGIIPIAFCMPGTMIILDEWDAQNEETAFVLQRPLQKEDRSIFLLETRELITMHPDNVISATANTNGQGDDTGLYGHGTRIQSYAQLNRFTITVKLNYLPPEQEKKILEKTFETLDGDEIDSLVGAVNKVRDGFTNGQLSVPLSTRDLLNWAQKYVLFGDAQRAATYCFLNRMSTEDAAVTASIIQRSFADS